METVKFILRTERETGRSYGSGKNSKFETISKKKEITSKQALSYFKKIKGVMGYVSPVNKGYRLFYCKTGKFAVEDHTRRPAKVKLFSSFEKALKFISHQVKKDNLKMSLEVFEAYPDAKKYQYNFP